MAKKQPERMCIACRSMKAKRDLFRLVVQADHLVLDETGKRPGRGAYLCRNRACIEKAVKEKRLEQHLKHRPSPAELAQLEETIKSQEEALAAATAAAEAAARLAAMPAVAVGDRFGQTVRIKKKGRSAHDEQAK